MSEFSDLLHLRVPAACPCGWLRDTLFLAPATPAEDVDRAVSRRREYLARLCPHCLKKGAQNES